MQDMRITSTPPKPAAAGMSLDLNAELALLASCTSIFQYRDVLLRDAAPGFPAVEALVSAAGIILHELGWGGEAPNAP